MIGLVLAAVVVSSQVTDVTVYNDRAQVVRVAKVDLKEGVNHLRFENLPMRIDSRAIKVDGVGGAVVQEVRYKVETVEVVPKAEWKALKVQQEELRKTEKELVEDLDVQRNAKSFLSEITKKITHKSNAEEQTPLDPEKWDKMLTLYTDKSMKYDKQIRVLSEGLKKVREKLDVVQKKIQSTGANLRKQVRVIEVDLKGIKAGKAEVRLSYIVYGPSWTPIYDVRVATKKRKMIIDYFAMISQSTGEDWTHVNLKLSTANPSLGGEHPQLTTWWISKAVARQQQKVYLAGKARNMFPSEQKSMQQQFGLSQSNEFKEDAIQERNQNFKPRRSRLRYSGTSVAFDVEGKSSVKSDKVSHRVSLARLELPAHFRYSVVPKLDLNAYFKAKAVNSENYPFLRGKAHIYLDGNYVTTSEMQAVAPKESFWVFLGVDEGIKVEYKLIKKYKSVVGFRSKTYRESFEYLIVVKNNHSTAEEVIVWDSLPRSQSEDIEVELVKPNYSKDTDALRIDSEKRIKWFSKLAPAAEWKIPFEFNVEYPKTMHLQGLK